MEKFHLYYITGERPQYFACWRCWSHDIAFFMQRAKYTWRGDYLGTEYVLIFPHVTKVNPMDIADILEQLTQREAENEQAQY